MALPTSSGEGSSGDDMGSGSLPSPTQLVPTGPSSTSGTLPGASSTSSMQAGASPTQSMQTGTSSLPATPVTFISPSPLTSSTRQDVSSPVTSLPVVHPSPSTESTLAQSISATSSRATPAYESTAASNRSAPSTSLTGAPSSAPGVSSSSQSLSSSFTGYHTTTNGSTTSMPESTEASASRGLGTGTIIGVAVGGGFVLLILILIVVCVVRRRRAKTVYFMDQTVGKYGTGPRQRSVIKYSSKPMAFFSNSLYEKCDAAEDVEASGEETKFTMSTVSSTSALIVHNQSAVTLSPPSKREYDHLQFLQIVTLSPPSKREYDHLQFLQHNPGEKGTRANGHVSNAGSSDPTYDKLNIPLAANGAIPSGSHRPSQSNSLAVSPASASASNQPGLMTESRRRGSQESGGSRHSSSAEESADYRPLVKGAVTATTYEEVQLPSLSNGGEGALGPSSQRVIASLPAGSLYDSVDQMQSVTKFGGSTSHLDSSISKNGEIAEPPLTIRRTASVQHVSTVGIAGEVPKLPARRKAAPRCSYTSQSSSPGTGRAMTAARTHSTVTAPGSMQPLKASQRSRSFTSIPTNANILKRSLPVPVMLAASSARPSTSAYAKVSELNGGAANQAHSACSPPLAGSQTLPKGCHASSVKSSSSLPPTSHSQTNTLNRQSTGGKRPPKPPRSQSATFLLLSNQSAPVHNNRVVKSPSVSPDETPPPKPPRPNSMNRDAAGHPRLLLPDISDRKLELVNGSIPEAAPPQEPCPAKPSLPLDLTLPENHTGELSVESVHSSELSNPTSLLSVFTASASNGSSPADVEGDHEAASAGERNDSGEADTGNGDDVLRKKYAKVDPVRKQASRTLRQCLEIISGQTDEVGATAAAEDTTGTSTPEEHDV
eukprot:scpid30302/ scgid1806/ 